MLVIVAALGAAAAWGIGAACDNRSTRLVGALQALAWVQVVGFVMVLPMALWEGTPSRPSGHAIAWIVVGGIGVSIGLALSYAAISRGAISVVASVTAVDGALAALASVALGEHIAIATAAGLAIVIAGMLVVLHATAAQERAGIAGHSLTAVLLAAGSACGFGLFLLASIRAGDALGDGQLQLLYRIVPFAVVGLPLLLRGQLGRMGAAWTWISGAAALQTAGFVLYRVAGRSGHVAIPSVLSSQFAVFAIVAGVVVLGERLSHRQVGGLAGLLVGVALIADAAVTGIIGGLLAALLWGSSTVTDARATRIVGSLGVLGWSSIAGCTLTLPVALIFAHDTTGVNGRGILWLTVSSLAAVSAFAPFYRAVQLGPVPLVAGFGATEGGVAAAISFATGERLPALTLVGLVVALGGMILVLVSVRTPVPTGHGHPLKAGLLATLAATLFGLSLFAGARAIDGVPDLWLPAGSRTFGTVLVGVPLLLMGKLPPPGRFLRFTFYSALAQSTGYFAFLVAADSSGVSVPAVLASQASVVGMVISFLVLHERLSRRQLAGIAALLTGVAIVAATR